MVKRPTDEQWLTLEEAAVLLEMPWATVYRWARDGDPRLPAYRVWDKGAGNKDQGRFRFKKEDVDALVALSQPPELAVVSS